MAKDKEIKNIIKMLEEEDAKGIDGILYRHEDKGIGMLAIAVYQGLKSYIKQEVD